MVKMYNTSGNYRVNLITVAICILILSQILNPSRFSAGIGAIKIPFCISFGLILIYSLNYGMRLKKFDVIITLGMVLSCILSTTLSNIVSWDASGSSLVLCLLLYLCVSNIKLSSVTLTKILKFYTLVSFGLSLWILVNFLNGINIIWGDRASITVFGQLKDPNYLASFLIFGFAYLTYSIISQKRIKTYLIIMDLIIFAGIFFAGSRGGFLTVVFVIAVIVAKILFADKFTARKVMLFLLVLLALGLGYAFLSNSVLSNRMLDVKSYSGNIRLLIWKEALNAFWNSPLFGSGIQSGGYYSKMRIQYATHNCYIDLLTGQGLFGVALIFISFSSYFKVPRYNLFFMIGIFASLFIPLFFINGYEAMTFWLPVILCRFISDFCKKKSCEKLLWL